MTTDGPTEKEYEPKDSGQRRAASLAHPARHRGALGRSAVVSLYLLLALALLLRLAFLFLAGGECAVGRR